MNLCIIWKYIGCMYVCMNVSVLSHQKYNKKYTKGSSYNCNKKVNGCKALVSFISNNAHSFHPKTFNSVAS